METDASIVNIVASGDIGIGELDTDAVVEDIAAETTTERPSVAYLKSDEIESTVMIYRSGTFTVAGATSTADVDAAVSWLARCFRDIGLDVDEEAMLASTTIKYIVVAADLGERINLSQAVMALGMEHSEYEPEQFPAVMYWPPQNDCTVLLFSTGKITVTGIRSMEVAQQCIRDVQSRLQSLGVLPMPDTESR